MCPCARECCCVALENKKETEKEENVFLFIVSLSHKCPGHRDTRKTGQRETERNKPAAVGTTTTALLIAHGFK